VVKNSSLAGVVQEHARWLPKVNTQPVPGSAQRVLTQTNGVWFWEGRAIRPEEKDE